MVEAAGGRVGGLLLAPPPAAGSPASPAPPALAGPSEPVAAARVAAARVLMAMVSDSLHGAEVGDRACAMLTPRFRPHFEARAEGLIRFCDGEHHVGRRKWGGASRELLRQRLGDEVELLLHITAAGQPPQLPPCCR